MNQVFTIQNFGPIVNASRTPLKISKLTVFCGKQGAGKSSVAKLISVFCWLEKTLDRGDVTLLDLAVKNAFKDKYCSFHNIQSYFKKDTYLFFKGKKYSFEYKNGNFLAAPNARKSNFIRPQVMYIPSERNLMTAIENAEKIQNLPQSLSVLLSEYSRALKSATSPIALHLDDYKVGYDEATKTSWLSDSKFKIKMSEAASGIQSLAPMVIVSRYLLNKIKANKRGKGYSSLSEEDRNKLMERITKLLNDNSLSNDVRKQLISQLDQNTFNGRLINIVEEPEQNLYPDTQRQMLNELLKVNNELAFNQLIITTHSPYLLNYLTLAVKADNVKNIIRRNSSQKDAMLKRLESIVPRSSTVNAKGISIYEISKDGEFYLLGNYGGIPSDQNFLNDALVETNDLFDKLLELEEDVQP